ncbi:hypothetical protein [Paeniglutamicibacter terrestris]|uniref:Uncharacterized protein n=1 Tax=Paeniglutamicibacter terrestris TaxID=2723403 RepID=A0ABX1G2Q2_9MICC|nr:hypothetical protein [Paeniglutamicibacter terrestris]NKG20526.1 hypothetical protein [Paeniglutamicibacter terrestris]
MAPPHWPMTAALVSTPGDGLDELDSGEVDTGELVSGEAVGELIWFGALDVVGPRWSVGETTLGAELSASPGPVEHPDKATATTASMIGVHVRFMLTC